MTPDQFLAWALFLVALVVLVSAGALLVDPLVARARGLLERLAGADGSTERRGR